MTGKLKKINYWQIIDYMLIYAVMHTNHNQSEDWTMQTYLIGLFVSLGFSILVGSGTKNLSLALAAMNAGVLVTFLTYQVIKAIKNLTKALTETRAKSKVEVPAKSWTPARSQSQEGLTTPPFSLQKILRFPPPQGEEIKYKIYH